MNSNHFGWLDPLSTAELEGFGGTGKGLTNKNTIISPLFYT
jgi:hypothetical protein